MLVITVNKQNIPQLAALHSRCFTQPYDPSWSAKKIADCFNHSNYQIKGLFNQDRIMGFYIGMIGIETCDLLTLAVDPDFQRQGVGTKLLINFLETTQKPCFLEVSDQNQSAIQLYLKMGFAQISRRKNYYQVSGCKACDALIMKHPGIS